MHLFFEENKRKQFKRICYFSPVTIFKNLKKRRRAWSEQVYRIYLKTFILIRTFVFMSTFSTQNGTTSVHLLSSPGEHCYSLNHVGRNLHQTWRLKTWYNTWSKLQGKYRDNNEVTEDRSKKQLLDPSTTWMLITTFKQALDA